MRKVIDLTGQQFGQLTVLNRAENMGSYTAWVCMCECGNKKIVRGNCLKAGTTKSCGCISKRIRNNSCSYTKLYGIWRSMKSRCYNPRVPVFKNYGGRGITVCNEWLNNFHAFQEWALSNGYAEKLTIERIDNNKGYSPENCRWATAKEQTRNRRCTRIVNGKTIGEWSEITGIGYNTLLNRADKGFLECFKE